MTACSPRLRGWSHDAQADEPGVVVLPAPAGMVPGSWRAAARSRRAPRACGDGPAIGRTVITRPACSPRLRGWSMSWSPVSSSRQVLPAPAGMVPRRPRWSPVRAGAPRACGDGPYRGSVGSVHAMCSPRLRGWSLVGHRRLRGGRVLPAPAGMVPGRRTPPAASGRAPRACGDGPVTRGSPLATRGVLPAPAGMVPRPGTGSPDPECAPHACGDGPEAIQRGLHARGCSPRLRGWSRDPAEHAPGAGVLPAPAGMVPRLSSLASFLVGAPRACGDGPAWGMTAGDGYRCSPRLRGWSLLAHAGRCGLAVLPAPAGMVPRRDPRGPGDERAPRACGDGPIASGDSLWSKVCSPRLRGWSHPVRGGLHQRLVLPAPAGMVPGA